MHFDDLENTTRLGLRHRHKAKKKTAKVSTGKSDTVDNVVTAPMSHGTSTMGAPALDKQAVPKRTASASEGSAASPKKAGSRAASTSKNPPGFIAGGSQSVVGEATGLVPEALASDGQHETGTLGLPGSNPIMQHAYGTPGLPGSSHSHGTPGLPGLIHGMQCANGTPGLPGSIHSHGTPGLPGSSHSTQYASHSLSSQGHRLSGSVQGLSMSETTGNTVGVANAEPTGVFAQSRPVAGAPSDTLGPRVDAGCPPGLASVHSGVGSVVPRGITDPVHSVVTTEAGSGHTSVVSTMHAPIFAVSGPPQTASFSATLEGREGRVNSQTVHHTSFVLESQPCVDGQLAMSIDQLPYQLPTDHRGSSSQISAHHSSSMNRRDVVIGDGYTRQGTRDTRQASSSQGAASNTWYPSTQLDPLTGNAVSSRLDPFTGNAVRHGYSGMRQGTLTGTHAVTAPVPQYPPWFPQSLWQQGGRRC